MQCGKDFQDFLYYFNKLSWHNKFMEKTFHEGKISNKLSAATIKDINALVGLFFFNNWLILSA